jgi:hypothetical protein
MVLYKLRLITFQQDHRVTITESDISALEAEQIVQNDRMTAIETVNTQQDSNLALEVLRLDQNDIDVAALTSDAIALEIRVTTLEATDIAQASQISTIQSVNTTQDGAISALESSFTTVDSTVSGLVTENLAQQGEIDALNAQVLALENAQEIHKKQPIVISATDVTNGYVDLAFLIVSESMIASTDRISLYEGASEDYTISTVAGVSRITFLNDLVSPSESALADGDKLHVKYSYKLSEQI